MGCCGTKDAPAPAAPAAAEEKQLWSAAFNGDTEAVGRLLKGLHMCA